MDSYLVPRGYGEAEFVEKKSRFIGNIWPVETEEEARTYIEEIKKKHYDARHNCWAYRLKAGGVERYADDGEPQGTAGQPILNVSAGGGLERSMRGDPVFRRYPAGGRGTDTGLWQKRQRCPGRFRHFCSAALDDGGG